MKNLIFILPMFLLACKPQKSVIEYKYLYKTDTLISVKTNTVYKGVTDTITIDNPCDSLGIINNFYSKLVLPNGTITLRSERSSGKLKAFVKINDAISSIKSETQSRTSDSIARKEKEVKVPYIPDWVIWSLIATSLLSFLYIRDLVKKYLII